MASMGLELMAQDFFLNTENCNQIYKTEAMPEVKVLVEYAQEESNWKTNNVLVINSLKLLFFDIGG